MSNLAHISRAELESLYSPEDHDRIAFLLDVQSGKGRAKVKERIFRIASSYDAHLFEFRKRPYNSETRKSLKDIRDLAFKLTSAIGECNDYARTEVAFALSLIRKERSLSTGEEVIPYGYPLSNQWIFDKESLAAFVVELTSLDTHLSAQMEKLKPGGRPRQPERDVIESLIRLWKKRYRKYPFEQFFRPFTELCELALRPIAARHSRTPNIASTARNVLYRYNLELPPKPWDL